MTEMIAEIDHDDFDREHPRSYMSLFDSNEAEDFVRMATKAIERDLGWNLTEGGGSVSGWTYRILSEPYSVTDVEMVLRGYKETSERDDLARDFTEYDTAEAWWEAHVPCAWDMSIYAEYIEGWKRLTVVGMWHDFEVNGLLVVNPDDPTQVKVLFG